MMLSSPLGEWLEVVWDALVRSILAVGACTSRSVNRLWRSNILSPLTPACYGHTLAHWIGFNNFVVEGESFRHLKELPCYLHGYLGWIMCHGLITLFGITNMSVMRRHGPPLYIASIQPLTATPALQLFGLERVDLPVVLSRWNFFIPALLISLAISSHCTLIQYITNKNKNYTFASRRSCLISCTERVHLLVDETLGSPDGSDSGSCRHLLPGENTAALDSLRAQFLKQNRLNWSHGIVARCRVRPYQPMLNVSHTSVACRLPHVLSVSYNLDGDFWSPTLTVSLSGWYSRPCHYKISLHHVHYYCSTSLRKPRRLCWKIMNIPLLKLLLFYLTCFCNVYMIFFCKHQFWWRWWNIPGKPHIDVPVRMLPWDRPTVCLCTSVERTRCKGTYRWVTLINSGRGIPSWSGVSQLSTLTWWTWCVRTGAGTWVAQLYLLACRLFVLLLRDYSS